LLGLATAAVGKAGPSIIRFRPRRLRFYSPIGEGFDSPIEPREDLKGPAPLVDNRLAAIRAANPGLETFKSVLPRYRAYAEQSNLLARRGRVRDFGAQGADDWRLQSGYLANLLQFNAVL
jgi:hypothetical protein